MLHKVYRKIFELLGLIASTVRILHLKMKYPNIEIIGTTYIARNCEIVCVDGGKMILKNAHINYGSFVFCANGAELIIDSAYIGMNSVVVALEKIHIKPNCEIAEMVVIRDQDHQHNLSGIPIKEQGFNSNPIIINENVWIGAKATILKGVEITANSVVGANAVVTKSIIKPSVVAGTPAKEIIKKIK